MVFKFVSSNLRLLDTLQISFQTIISYLFSIQTIKKHFSSLFLNVVKHRPSTHCRLRKYNLGTDHKIGANIWVDGVWRRRPHKHSHWTRTLQFQHIKSSPLHAITNTASSLSLVPAARRLISVNALKIQSEASRHTPVHVIHRFMLLDSWVVNPTAIISRRSLLHLRSHCLDLTPPSVGVR